MSDDDDVENKYKDLVAACWTIYANKDAAAARISLMFEVYPEFALRKLREQPEFFGPLRRDNPSLLSQNDTALVSTALTIRERAREFRDALEAQTLEDREQDRDLQRRRRRERDR